MMTQLSDSQLLQNYVETGSHEAFAELVNRYSSLVYGSAQRRVHSSDLADDVTQAVFIVLARKAKSIKPNTQLGPWLYKVTKYAAVDAMRRHAVRQKHESQAAQNQSEVAMHDQATWDHLAPLLDQAIDQLSSSDREMILLRYFQNQTLEQIARSTGAVASTIQRRVNRAIEKLRAQLMRSNLAVDPNVLIGLIAANALPSAPIGTLTHITALATAAQLSTGSSAIGIAQGAMKTMTLLKLKLAAMITIGATVVVTGGVAIEKSMAQTKEQAASNIRQVQQAIVNYTPPTDLSKVYIATWTDSSLQSYVYNNAYRDNAKIGREPPKISIQFAVDPKAIGSDVIGYDQSWSTTVDQVIDSDGHTLELPPAQGDPGTHMFQRPSYVDRYDNVAQGFVSEIADVRQQINLPMTKESPARLSSVTGSFWVIRVEKIEHVDLPLDDKAAPVDLLPGQKIHFKQLKIDGNSMNYELETIDPKAWSLSRNPYDFHGSVSSSQPLPSRFIMDHYLIDKDGQEVERHRHAPFFSSGGSEVGSMGGTNLSKATAMRFEIAVNPKMVQIPFELKDIQLPTIANIPAK